MLSPENLEAFFNSSIWKACSDVAFDVIPALT
jgi:hypothetical protein